VRISKLKEVIGTISDHTLLEEKHSNQFKAFMWMVHLDPVPLDLDTTPHHIIRQKYIMVLLYVSTAGRDWKNQYSFLTSPTACDWDGLKCNDEKEIVAVDLENNNLNGTLVSEIGALGPSLQELKLGSNLLRGEIPSEIGLLSGLITLDLYDNIQITGHIPSEISARLLPNLRQVQLIGTSIGGNLDSLCSTTTATDDDNDQQFDGDNGDHATNTNTNTNTIDIDIRANCLEPWVMCTCCSVCCDETGSDCRSY